MWDIFQPGDIANNFHHIFSILETLIKSLSQGGAGGPYPPTYAPIITALICILAYHRQLGTCDYVVNSFILLFGHQNMGLDTLFIQLSAILAEIRQN